MLLLDKGYYDYDFEYVEPPTVTPDWESTIKSDEEVQDILSSLGIGRKKQMTDEELQNFINKEEEIKHGC